MLAEASLTGFVKTLLIIVLVIWSLRILFRWAAPYMLRFFLNRVSRKMQNEFQKAQEQYSQNAYGQPSYGQATGSNNPYKNNRDTTSKNPKATKQVGEYIDYEEV